MTKTVKIVCLALLAAGIALFFIDRSQLTDFLPFLFILACPVMHLFMHSGHDRDSHEKEESDAGHGAAHHRV